MNSLRSVTVGMVFAATAVLAACGDDNAASGAATAADECAALELPLNGTSDAPVLTQLILHCSENYVELSAVVEDPQGTPDLGDVQQILSVHRSSECDDGTIELVDDFIGSGEEEGFGIAVEKDQDPELLSAICGSERWPVEVALRDASGNETSGVAWADVAAQAQ